ncbi:hypothetical protein LDO26_03010 [Luteimonas sp. BDR2-5]|uniref:hypothetical protein n=1 Tax=Proluteimonas luteida TaxID=2878685 RepID=UPI001E535337|nr:hypothetical protein [Luteimonas sp. BDR2-5]MCD9027185.1 hypothetical protein [Luteimonas sp. BDR2-5]
MNKTIVIAAFLFPAVLHAGESRLVDNPEIFTCSPGTVSSGDTVLLSKNGSRLRELAVVRPGGQTGHFLVVDLPPREMQPFMTPDELDAVRQVAIAVDSLTGLEWRTGAAQERVFTVPGIYEFIIGPNLESEDYAYVCRIRYQPPASLAASRPSATAPAASNGVQLPAS